MIVNTSGSHQESSSRTVAQGLWPLIPIGIATVSLSALVYYHFKQLDFTPSGALQHLYAWIYQSFGLAPSFLFFLLVLMWSTVWLLTGELQKPGGKMLRITAMAVLVGIFLNLGEGGVSPGLHKGALGAWLADGLVAAFGYVPSLVLVFAMTFASMLLATDFFFSDGFERLRQGRVDRGFEQGVEDEVTERLRSLGSTPSPAVAGGAPLAVGAVTTSAVVPPPLPIGVDDVPPFVPSPEPVAELPRRRSSYFERRRERYAADEDWVPPAPESTEIDNPESRAVGEPEVAAAAVPPGEAIDPSDAVDEPRSEVHDAWAAESLLREREETVEPVAEAPAVEPMATASPEVRAVSDFGETFLDEPAVDAPAQRWTRAIDLGAPEPVLEPLPEVVADTAGSAEVAEPEPVAAAEAAEVVLATGFDDDADVPLVPEEVGAEAIVEPLVDDEPVVAIPRPEVAPPQAVELASAASVDEPVLVPTPEPTPEPVKQQNLFGGGLDEALVNEAIDLVTETGRAGVAFLQRKLRIDYDLASDLMAELAARGVIAVEGDASQGRGRS